MILTQPPDALHPFPIELGQFGLEGGPALLGGSNEVTNLWPEPYCPKPGAREKDVLEDFLHRAVCGGAMALEDAQRKIATDWYKAYQEMKGIQP